MYSLILESIVQTNILAHYAIKKLECINKNFVLIVVKNLIGLSRCGCFGDQGEVNNMSRSIQLDSDGNDITCMKEFDALKYPCRECDKEDCNEREEYKETENRK